MFSITPRLRSLQLALFAFIGILIIRLVFLQIIEHDFYVAKSQSQVNKVFMIYPNRGEIYDRNGTPLAFSSPVYSAYAIPTQVEDKVGFARTVSAITGQQYETVFRLVNNNGAFIWIKRKLDDRTHQQLATLNIQGLNFVQEDLRVYPQNQLLSHVLGFVGIDNQGLGGLEYKFDRILQGNPGRIMLEGDPRGYRLVSGKKETRDPFQGANITTTIDIYLQYICQKYLREGVIENGGEGGQVIIMNPKTGDILAMADYPEFDSNTWRDSTDTFRKNSTITDVYEPGSVFKLVTLAGILNEGLVTTRTVMTVPQTLTIGGRTIREAHGRSAGETDSRTVSEIIEKSLNVGTSLLAMKLGQKKFYHYITEFGFGKRTEVELPAESRGILNSIKHWTEPDIAMISFGQGVAVTPIQMVSAVSIIANHGEKIKPRIVWQITEKKDLSVHAIPITSEGQVISEKTAREVVNVMKETVHSGTGVGAKIPGYSIGGKTGTAQKVRQGGFGYEPGKYVASFIGFFPADDPQVVILVIVDSPSKSIYGATVAIPIFKKIALATIDHLDIYPDQPTQNLVR